MGSILKNINFKPKTKKMEIEQAIELLEEKNCYLDDANGLKDSQQLIAGLEIFNKYFPKGYDVHAEHDELSLCDFSEEMTTTPGAATPTFGAVSFYTTGTAPSSVSICDLNGDGKPDVAVTNPGSDLVNVLLNTTTPGASIPDFSIFTSFTT